MTIGIIIGVVELLVFLVWFCYYNNNHIEVSKYRLSDGESKLRIVHLSDLHSKEFGKDNCKLYKTVEEQAPDIIFITGDLIDWRKKRIEQAVDFAGRLTNLCPVVYIFGNHEHRAGITETVKEKLEEKRVKVLNNEAVSIDINGVILAVLGLDEGQATDLELYKKRKRGEFEYEDNSELFRELENMAGEKIVLTHFPENFNSNDGYSYCRYNFDVQFSGHAHGGQFRLPFFGGVYSPGQGLRPKYCQGVYGDRPKLVVSRGLGNSRFPLRLFNYPEVVVAEI